MKSLGSLDKSYLNLDFYDSGHLLNRIKSMAMHWGIFLETMRSYEEECKANLYIYTFSEIISTCRR